MKIYSHSLYHSYPRDRPACFFQAVGLHFAGAAFAALKLLDAGGIDIEADDGIGLRQSDRKRQADIAKPHDYYFTILAHQDSTV